MEKFMRHMMVLGLVLATTACGRAFDQPEVTLRNVQVAGLGLRGGTLLVDVDIRNPNRFSLSANSLDYQLSIADRESSGDTIWHDFASGTYDEAFTVAAGETGSVQIPVEFSYGGFGGAASSLLRAGSFNYRAAGTVNVRTPVGTYDIPFTRRGMMSLLSSR